MNANADGETLRDILNRNWNWLQLLTGTSVEGRKAQSGMLEDLGHYEESIRQAYTGRYPVELLQNAQDACEAAAEVGAVRFAVTDTSLLVSNSGVAFNAERIESLTRLGSSEKARGHSKRKTIGYKGVGFTAVFEVTDTPQIITQGIAFGLDRLRAKRQIQKMLGEEVDAIPARMFPFELDPADWDVDAAAIRRLFELGAVTVVRLPYARAGSPEEVAAHVRTAIQPTALLFLDHVNEIEVVNLGASSSWKKRAGRRVKPGRVQTITSSCGERESWLVARSSARISRTITEALNDRLWTNIREVDVAVAVPWIRGGIDGAAEPRNVHVYFPTDDFLGRAVLVHGDFYVDQSRRHIEDHGPGAEVSFAVAKKVAHLIGTVAELHAGQGQSLLSALAVRETPSGYGKKLGTLIDEQLARTRFVRPAVGDAPRRPGELKRLPTSVGPKLNVQLAQLMRLATEVVRPGDDSGWAGHLLSGLEVPELTWNEVASRVDGASQAQTYDEWLNRLGRILGGLNSAGHGAFLAALRTRPIVHDRRGRWRTTVGALRAAVRCAGPAISRCRRRSSDAGAPVRQGRGECACAEGDVICNGFSP